MASQSRVLSHPPLPTSLKDPSLHTEKLPFGESTFPSQNQQVCPLNFFALVDWKDY